VSEVVDVTLYILFDSEVTKSISEMTGVKDEDKLYRDRNGDNLSIHITVDKNTYFPENKP